MLEIAGFWTPEYIAEKTSTLKLFKRKNLLVAVPANSPAVPVFPGENVITYQGKLDPDEVLVVLENMKQDV